MTKVIALDRKNCEVPFFTICNIVTILPCCSKLNILLANNNSLNPNVTVLNKEIYTFEKYSYYS